MLLLDVQVEIAPGKETLLNDWYYLHVPRLVSVPGYESGRRYVSLTPGPRYLALYEIRSRADLPSLLGSDRSRRHPLTLSEWARWDQDLVPHMSHCRTNVYEPVGNGGSPILRGDYALVIIHFGVKQNDEAALAAELQDEISQLLISEADMLGARLLKASRDPAVAWLETTPDHMLIIECAGCRAARDLADGDGSEANRVLDKIYTSSASIPQISAYRQIARHWPWFKET
jgi:hypothetical protein